METAEKSASLSGLEVRVLVGELSGQLVGSYVSNIHALGEAQIMRLRKPGGESQEASLILSPKFGAWITEKPAYTETEDFTSALRSRLLRTKLEAVSQHDLDRVIFLRFLGDGGPVQLVLEMIPPGNLLLIDESGRIIVSLRETKGKRGEKRTRTVARGSMYVPPPQSRTSPDQVSLESLSELFTREKTIGRALGRGISLPRKYVDEILIRAGLRQDDPAAEVPRKKLEEILTIIKKLLSDLGSPVPSLVERDGRVDVMPVTPATGRVIGRAETMSRLLDSAFTPLLLDEENRPEHDDEERDQARELKITLERLGTQIGALRDRAARLRALAMAVRASPSLEEARTLVAGATSGTVAERDLVEAQTTASMSSLLFDQAKNCEAEMIRIGEVEREVAARLHRAQRGAPRSRIRVVERSKREWYEKFRWFYTSEGRLAIGGRDAQSNSILVKKYAGEGDTVYHADLFGSPFFVLKGGREQTPEEVRQVAQATATFSSAWKTGLSAADAYWVEPNQVSSSAPSGEYLSRGSFVIRGKKNFVTKNPVEVAVGIDRAGRIVAGPEEAIMKQARAHVTLIPHREKASDTAKKVLFELRKLLDGEKMRGDSLDDVLRAIPPGGGKIVRRRENWKKIEDGENGEEPEEWTDRTTPTPAER